MGDVEATDADEMGEDASRRAATMLVLKGIAAHSH